MAKYIDKSVLVAEIERRRNDYINSFMTEQVYMLNNVLDFIDTLEVKEVDLEQPYREYINKTYTEEFAQSILDGNIKGDLDSSDLFGIMSYGIELGMSVSNKAQKGE